MPHTPETERLIDKEAILENGNAVYNADRKFTIGIPIAQVDEFKIASDGLTKEATLDLPYSFNNIRAVYVMK